MPALPTKEHLLFLADVAHNLLGNRGFDTIAVGAIGPNPFHVDLVLGINSSSYDEIGLNNDRLIPPIIRNNPTLQRLGVIMSRDPYHAEVSVVLQARERGVLVWGLAASRKICPTCTSFFWRHRDSLAPNCQIVDGWRLGGRILTHNDRTGIRAGWRHRYTARAVRM
ncbi:MAG: hypothetical protein AAGF11_05340 [Myxococcota bacterium]